MTYSELANKVIKNRAVIRTTKDLELKRKLIAENHDIMTKMDKMLSGK